MLGKGSDSRFPLVCVRKGPAGHPRDQRWLFCWSRSGLKLKAASLLPSAAAGLETSLMMSVVNLLFSFGFYLSSVSPIELRRSLLGWRISSSREAENKKGKVPLSFISGLE